MFRLMTYSLLWLGLSGNFLVPTGEKVAFAQSPRRTATQKDIPYHGLDPSQVLDLYLVPTETPLPTMVYLHGGGWRGGSKNGVPAWLMEGVQEKRFHVVSVEYRFTNVAPHPAQVNDCLRAIQYVRSRASEWKVDTQRVGVTGGSAGGHLSLYVALHDDVADPKAMDAVAKESSRVRCAVSFAGPTDWSLLSELEHKHPAYRQLLGYEPETPAKAMSEKSKQDVSPIHFASQDDPPILQVHGDQDDVVPIEHAKRLNDRLKKIGVRSELVEIPGGNHGVAGAGPAVVEKAKLFVERELLKSP